jgi:hypothetical protein
VSLGQGLNYVQWERWEGWHQMQMKTHPWCAWATPEQTLSYYQNFILHHINIWIAEDHCEMSEAISSGHLQL